MSQLTDALDALKATGDVGAFVSAIAADLQKDFQIVSALPGVKSFEDWLATELISLITKAGFTGTLAALIAQAIQDIL